MAQRDSDDVPGLSAGTVIYDKDNNLLFVLQKNNVWSLPKGSLKYNETIYEGALRETLEETQLNLSEYEPIAIEEYVLHGGQHYYLFVYKLNIRHDEIKLDNSKDLDSKHTEWIPESKLKEIKKNGKINGSKINFLTLSHLHNIHRHNYKNKKKISNKDKIRLDKYKTGKIINPISKMDGGRKSLKKELCSCIKKVRKTVRVRKGQNKSFKGREKAAIGICVKSVLQTRGRTLKRFRCGKNPYLLTQKKIN
jgi:ADP-ribose pyrophosphatase YjhB (NUDIX family)